MGTKLGGRGLVGLGLGTNFAKLWAALAVSNLGDGIRLTALPLVAAALTRDPALIAGLTVTLRLPWLFFGLPVGVLVDRYDARRLIAIANAAQGGLLLVLGLALSQGLAGVPLLYVVAFLLGIGELVVDISSQSILPHVVDRRLLESANGRLYGTELAANQLIGPPLGAVLFSVGMALPFFIDAASFVIAAGVVMLIKGEFLQSRHQQTAFRQEIGEAWSWLWRHRLLRTITLYHGVVNLLFAAIGATFVLYALEVLEAGAMGFALLLVSEAAGGLAGALLAARISARVGVARLVLAAGAIQGAAYMILGLTSNAWLAGVIISLAASAAVMSTVVLISLRQAIVPAPLLGRVTSTIRFVTWGVMPFGALLGGLIALSFGLRSTFIIAAPIFIVLLLTVRRVLTNDEIAKAHGRADVSAAAGY